MHRENLITLTPLRPAAAALAAALAGVLLILPFRIESLYPVAWLALVPLLVSVQGQSLKRSAALGLLAGTVAHLIGVYWLIGTMVRFGGVYPPVSFILYLFIATAFGTIYIPFTLACRLLPDRYLLNTVRGSMFIAAAFTASEYIFPSVFPWRLGYSQIRIPELVQIADVFGAYGITFITALAGAVLYQITLVIRMRNGNLPWTGMAGLAVLLVVYIGYGTLRLETVQNKTGDAGTVRIAMLQPNVAFDEKFDPALAARHISDLFEMSAQAAMLDVDLIIWPETGYRTPILADARQLEVPVTLPATTYLYLGANVFENAAGRFLAYNSALALSPDGTILGRYDKHRLFPFGEYLPLSDTFPILKKFSGPISDFRAGTGPPVQEFPNGIIVGPLICYEDIFPVHSRQAVRDGAVMLVNLTNDAWFGDTAAPHQHLQLALFRSIENRVSMIRATNSGVTAIVSPTGVIEQRLEVFTKNIIIADIPVPAIRTVYTEYGDIFAILCLLSVLITIAWRLVARRLQ